MLQVRVLMRVVLEAVYYEGCLVSDRMTASRLPSALMALRGERHRPLTWFFCRDGGLCRLVETSATQQACQK